MKTIQQWLNTLKEPYKTKALNNIADKNKETKTINLSNALLIAFKWSKTTEGYKYWDELHTKTICK